MENAAIGATGPYALSGSPILCRAIRLCCATLLFLMPMAVIPATSRAEMPQQAKPTGSEPTPEPAVPAILAAFGKYEVVGMPEAHGLKDLDDSIFSLIRNPAFAEKVNDIVRQFGVPARLGPLHSRRGRAFQ